MRCGGVAGARRSVLLAVLLAASTLELHGQDGRREQLERRLQQRLEAVVQQRLGLSDDQRGQLRDVVRRLEPARRILRQDEFRDRSALRAELMSAQPNETRVAQLLDAMPAFERRRAELLEQEQRELGRFLTPVQRARYFALQDEMRRGVMEVQRRRLGRDGLDGDSATRGAERRMPRRPPPPPRG